MISVSVVNKSTLYKDSDLPILCNALAIQVARDFFPAWNINAKIFFTPSGANPTPDHWPLVLFDNSDVASALGYHDLSATSQPLGKVFVATTLADNQKIEVTASHELLEMLLDPYVNLAAQDNSTLWAYEACDMVENDEYPVTIPAGWTGAGTSVPVSNFAYPNWWNAGAPGPYDHLGKLKSPFQLTAGGYMSFLDLNKPGNGWGQVNGRMDSRAQTVRSRPRPGSRRERRNIPRTERIISTYEPGDAAVPAEAS